MGPVVSAGPARLVGTGHGDNSFTHAITLLRAMRCDVRWMCVCLVLRWRSRLKIAGPAYSGCRTARIVVDETHKCDRFTITIARSATRPVRSLRTKTEISFNQTIRLMDWRGRRLSISGRTRAKENGATRNEREKKARCGLIYLSLIGNKI